jgi:hypothetical protein
VDVYSNNVESDLPVLDHLPSVSGNPLQGHVNPVNDMGIPLGGDYVPRHAAAD